MIHYEDTMIKLKQVSSSGETLEAFLTRLSVHVEKTSGKKIDGQQPVALTQMIVETTLNTFKSEGLVQYVSYALAYVEATRYNQAEKMETVMELLTNPQQMTSHEVQRLGQR